MLLYRMFNKLLIKNFLLKFDVFFYFLKYYIALVRVACLDCQDCSERHHYRIKPFNCASKSLITNKSAEEEGREAAATTSSKKLKLFLFSAISR